MTSEQIRRYETLVRVRDFGDEHADLFLESAVAINALSAVREAVRQLNEHTVSKATAIQGTTTKARARANLYERLEAVSQTARAIAEQNPDLSDRFLMPNQPSDPVLLTTARVFAHDAALLEEQFVAHAMPKTFLADLRAAMGRFEQAIHDRDAGRSERVAARTRIALQLDSGFSALRALDAIVANRLRDDPTTMVVWRRARRVHPSRRQSVRGGRRAHEPVPSSPSGTSPTATTTGGVPPAAGVTPIAEEVTS